MSSDKEQEYFSDGISEEILNVLAKIPKLNVTSRSSSFYYKGKDIKLNKVAEELGVKHILEGSVRKSGTRIRITAQLIEAGTDMHLWSETYDRELTDIFKIQDEISAAIVSALKSKLGIEIATLGVATQKVNIDAHNEFLKGHFYAEKRTRQDLEKAISHFDKAIELQPDYAAVWAGKGLAIILLIEYGDYIFSQEKATKSSEYAANKALSLDPDSPEAHTLMGMIYLHSDNQKKAVSYFQKAYTLNPNYADAYAWHSLREPDVHKRLQLVEKALQLNPLSLRIMHNYSFALSLLGRQEEVIKVLYRIIDIDNSYSEAYRMLAYHFRNTKQGEAAYYHY